jgi:hypothetical protein
MIEMKMFILGVIICGSVWFLLKKITKLKFKKKQKHRNRTETDSNRPVSVRFCFLEQKPVQLV